MMTDQKWPDKLYIAIDELVELRAENQRLSDSTQPLFDEINELFDMVLKQRGVTQADRDARTLKERCSIIAVQLDALRAENERLTQRLIDADVPLEDDPSGIRYSKDEPITILQRDNKRLEEFLVAENQTIEQLKGQLASVQEENKRLTERILELTI